MWLIKGTLLGSAIFVIFLFVVVYQRLRYGLSTPLSALNDLIFWLVLLVCLAAGCLIYYFISLIFKRRKARKA